MAGGDQPAPPPKNIIPTIGLIAQIASVALAGTAFAMQALKDDRAEIRETERRFTQHEADMAVLRSEIAVLKCRVGMLPGCTPAIAQAQGQNR